MGNQASTNRLMAYPVRLAFSGAALPLRLHNQSHAIAQRLSIRTYRKAIQSEPPVFQQSTWKQLGDSFQFQRGLRSSAGAPVCSSVNTKIDVDSSKSNVIISRVMGPDDTQMYGMVHGGVMLQLIEEAGTILSMQYCNSQGTTQKVTTVTACMERTDFLQPMFLGEVAEVHAEIGYTSKQSVQVIAEVFAKNVQTGQVRLTSKSRLWYVPLTSGKESKPVLVPMRTYDNPQEEELGRRTYEKLKQLRENVIRPRLKANPVRAEDLTDTSQGAEPQSVNFSRVVTRHPLQPANCWAGESYVRGGVVMKAMDEAGSLTASTHSTYPAFTVAVDTIMFLKKIRLANLMVVTSKPIFTSTRSMEILMAVDCLKLVPGKGFDRERAAEAVFTFISPNEKGTPRELPPLKLKTKEEIQLFEERKQLYEMRQKKTDSDQK